MNIIKLWDTWTPCHERLRRRADRHKPDARLPTSCGGCSAVAAATTACAGRRAALTIGFPPPCSPRGLSVLGRVLIVMDDGRESIVRDDWKKIFDDDEDFDEVIGGLRLDQMDRRHQGVA